MTAPTGGKAASFTEAEFMTKYAKILAVLVAVRRVLLLDDARAALAYWTDAVDAVSIGAITCDADELARWWTHQRAMRRLVDLLEEIQDLHAP